MRTTLRIKKIYMDRIRVGEKSVEYRKNSPYYRALLKKSPTTLLLHYQKRERLLVQVTSVRLIKRPKRFAADDSLPTRQIFAIKLGRVISWTRP